MSATVKRANPEGDAAPEMAFRVRKKIIKKAWAVMSTL